MCSLCTADWWVGEWTDGCVACGGGSLVMPCFTCRGEICRGQSSKATVDSFERKMGIWNANCTANLEAYKVSTAPHGYWDAIKAGHFPDCDLDKPWKEYRDQEYGETALHMSCYFGHYALAQFYLKKIGVHTQGWRCGSTALHSAASGGHQDIVALLLQNKASPLARTFNGMTPLHSAAAANHFSVVKLLAEANPKALQILGVNRTPVQMTNSPQIADYLRKLIVAEKK